jgi:ubiquinone/menaquinone biosynthesis C-methylase UbiE
LFPRFLQPVSIFFRTRRNRRLCAIIDKMWEEKTGTLEVLDIGGSVVFWLSIPEAYRAKCHVSLINLPEAYEVNFSAEEEKIKQSITLLTGDARDLSLFSDKSFDLAICNSVIEHVGSWADMTKAANEARRVAKRGWIQVPAFEFPIEQHFLMPLVHWFADPIQVMLLRWLHGPFSRYTVFEQYMSVHHTRPLTRTQLRNLFPGAALRSEWFLFPKSHIATW